MSTIVKFYDPHKENGYLSNWFISPFTYAGRRYFSCEQYLMEQKALTFGDDEIAEKIMKSRNLSEIKRLGKQVARYNENLWKTIRPQVMRRGLRAKFQQNPELLLQLLGTGSAILCECAPRDAIWGIGLAADDPRSDDTKEWRGRNLLGRALMRVREDMRAWCAVAGERVTEYVDAVDLKTPKQIRARRRSSRGADDYEPYSKGEDTNIWSMRIYEACMLPYVSEIVSTWLEEVFYDVRHGHSYEDLGITNYTFENLESMFRNERINGIPFAGFYEMKQDLFDMMRYQGGLRNPAAILVKPAEAAEEPVAPAPAPAANVTPAPAPEPAAPKAAEPVVAPEPVAPAPAPVVEPEPAPVVPEPSPEEEEAEAQAIIAQAKAEEAAAVARAEAARQAALAAKYRAEQMKAMAQAAFERARLEAEARAKADAEAREQKVAKKKEEAEKAIKEAESKMEARVQEIRRAETEPSTVTVSIGKLTECRSESIVNVTTQTLAIGKGVDDELFDAGGAELKRAVMAIKGCENGKAVITGGGALPAKFVIHTACPRYDGDGSDKKYLERCYNSVLDLAMSKGIHEVAIPPIGTGFFGFPLRESAIVANQTVDRWMLKHADYSIKVRFICPDQRTEAMFRSLRK
ncbi:MAG: NADAR domain-containing protein [Lachnospiraceae bacterium]|nr:NADAR domain-containing protein [Lachnospiraceae bacterium]